MRILHVIDSLDPAQGGPPDVVLNLAAAQLRHGHTVTVLSHCPTDRRHLMEDSVAALGIRDTLRTVILENRPLSERLAGVRSRRAMVQLRRETDVIHVHGAWRPMLAWAFIIAGTTPLMATPHGMISRYGLAQKPLRKRLALSLFWRRALQSAGTVQALAVAEAGELAAVLSGVRLEIIPNGINPLDYAGTMDRTEFHRLHPELEGQPYVLFLARLDRVKGLDLLIHAFELVATRVIAKLVIAGPDSGFGAAVRRLVVARGLAARVVFVGPLSGAHKRAALAGAACLCQPSRYECFGISVLEALASGVPVVISDQHGLGLRISNAGIGKVVPLQVREISAAILEYLCDSDLQSSTGAAARRFVLANFAWDRIAGAIVAEYEKLVAERMAAPPARL